MDAGAVALEVRVLWGGDVLRVHHFSPPRTFTAGEAGCDLALATAHLGAPWFPIVEVQRDRVDVVAPPGVRGSIQSEARHVALESAVDAGMAEPDRDRPGALRIRLSGGLRVTLAVPSRAAMSGYRAAPADTYAAEARVIVEVALVPAARSVGRGALFDGRAAVSTLVAAGVLLGGLGAQAGPPPIEEDEVSQEQQYLMQSYLQAAAEREMERAEEEEKERMTLGEIAGLLNAPAGASGAGWNPPSYFPGPPPNEWQPQPVLDETPYEAPAELPFFGLHSFCVDERRSGALAAFCDAPPLTPFGLRGVAVPPVPRAFDPAPNPLWVAWFEEELRHVPPRETGQGFGGWRPYFPPVLEKPVVGVTVVRGPGETEPARLLRAVHARHAALQGCYELRLMWDVNLQGSLEMDVVIGADGLLRTRMNRVESTAGGCMAGALDGMRIWPAPRRAETARLKVEMKSVRLENRR